MKITYSLALSNMRESQMREIVAVAKERKISYALDVEVTMPEQPKANGKLLARVNAADYVILGNIANIRPGTIAETLVKKLQRFEKKHGVRSCSRGELTAQIEEDSDAPHAAIGGALKNGYIIGVKNDDRE